ncbi:MAG TPA: PEP-CTERM sorting domain-containing protein [Terriglobales bacterium]|nr:PEP-CTERM sorting domain-containing protein [Terriglobales bacterium]
MIKRFCQLFLLLALTVVPALAESTLHIGPGYPSPCDTGGCPLYKGETNGFTNMLDIYQNSNGAPLLNNPVELIFAVPTGGAAPTISGLNLIDSDMGFKATPVTFTALGDQGTMTSGDVYTFLGLKVDKSDSLKNLAAWDLAVNGLHVSGFDIYIFQLNTGGFGANDFLTMNVNAPQGTFAFGYGTSERDKHTTEWGTPFTEAGLGDGHPPSVPEPASLLLMGSGFLSALAAIRRRVLR